MFSPRRIMVANFERNWDKLPSKPKKKLLDVLHEIGWKPGSSWELAYDKMSSVQKLQVVAIMKHAGVWSSSNI